MLHLLMLFHICEHIGFANCSIFLCGCWKDFEAQCNSHADAVLAKASHELFCTAQQKELNLIICGFGAVKLHNTKNPMSWWDFQGSPMGQKFQVVYQSLFFIFFQNSLPFSPTNLGLPGLTCLRVSSGSVTEFQWMKSEQNWPGSLPGLTYSCPGGVLCMLPFLASWNSNHLGDLES